MKYNLYLFIIKYYIKNLFMVKKISFKLIININYKNYIY